MDYHDDGIKIPPIIRPHLHLLRPVGLVLGVVGTIIPFLILIKLLISTFFINFLAYTFLVLFPILYLIGMAFDNYIDRGK
jgi:hypothetical protein